MPIQRKVFRIEQTAGLGLPSAAIADEAVSPGHQDEILAELKALHELFERRSTSEQTAEVRAIAESELRKLKEETDIIHRAITRTKQEIATLHSNAFGDSGYPRVTRELDAVMDGTERATQRILDAAEVIEEAANSLSASVTQAQEKALAQDIQDHVLRIFEACNFQDLSGQRITKVLSTLKFIEERIARMMDIWGGADAFRSYAAVPPVAGESKVLHGPMLEGDPDHATQAEVDAMFATRRS